MIKIKKAWEAENELKINKGSPFVKIDVSLSSMKPKPFSSSTPKKISDVEEGSNRAVCNTAKPSFLKDVSINTTVELDREFNFML